MSSDVERRLRDAFTALADAVDPAELPEPRGRGRKPMIAALVTAAAVIIAATGILVLGQRVPEIAPPANIPATPPPTSSPARIAYQLYTHCGINEAAINGAYYEAETPIPGPPNDWGNPYQQGFMEIVSRTEAVFRDDLGHVVKFRLREGATGFKGPPCD